jgi:hypothetical protein
MVLSCADNDVWKAIRVKNIYITHKLRRRRSLLVRINPLFGGRRVPQKWSFWSGSDVHPTWTKMAPRRARRREREMHSSLCFMGVCRCSCCCMHASFLPYKKKVADVCCAVDERTSVGCTQLRPLAYFSLFLVRLQLVDLARTTFPLCFSTLK